MKKLTLFAFSREGTILTRLYQVVSRACEALYGVGFKKRRFVSKRIAFFGNVVCLPNFRESVSLYWPREFVPTRLPKAQNPLGVRTMRGTLTRYHFHHP